LKPFYSEKTNCGPLSMCVVCPASGRLKNSGSMRENALSYYYLFTTVQVPSHFYYNS